MTGDYEVAGKFNEEHIPDSPIDPIPHSLLPSPTHCSPPPPPHPPPPPRPTHLISGSLMTGDYKVAVKFNEEHIPDSPIDPIPHSLIPLIPSPIH